MTKTRYKRKRIRQRLYGVAMVVFSVLSIYAVSTSGCLKNCDSGGAVVILCLGLYLMFTRKVVVL